MKGIIIAISFLTLSARGFAQTPADSIYLYGQSARLLDFAQKSGTQLVSSNFERVNTLGLGYQYVKGHFRRAQEAETDKSQFFSTSGITTLGRFKFAGNFNFSRTHQDSLKWTMQGLPNEGEPYFFGAGRAGKYDRIKYDFGGIVSYALKPEKLYLSVGADYLYNTATGSVDPRPSVQTYRLALKPELTYKWFNNMLGLGVLYGYSKEDNDVVIKNSGNRTQNDPLTTTLLFYGYGNVRDARGSDPSSSTSSRAKMKRDIRYTGANINYNWQSTNAYLKTILSYQLQIEDITRQLDASVTNGRIGYFRLDTYQILLLGGKHNASFHHQFFFNAGLQTGYDNNYADRGFMGLITARYSRKSANLGYTVITKVNSTSNVEFGANLDYDAIKKRGINQGIESCFQYLQPGINAAWHNKFKDASRLVFKVLPSLRLPVATTITEPGAVGDNIYLNYILYPDYTYFASTAGLLGVQVNYVTPRVVKDMYMGITFKCNYTKPFTLGNNYSTSAFSPSNSRTDLSMSVNLYF